MSGTEGLDLSILLPKVYNNESWEGDCPGDGINRKVPAFLAVKQVKVHNGKLELGLETGSELQYSSEEYQLLNC